MSYVQRQIGQFNDSLWALTVTLLLYPDLGLALGYAVVQCLVLT